MNVDASCESSADVFDRSGISDSSGMVVNQIFLEILNLVVGQRRLREFANPRIDTVHGLVVGELLLEHGAADFDAVYCRWSQLYFFAEARDSDEFFNG